MAKKKKDEPEPQWANRKEVENAVGSITDADGVRLNRYARWRMGQFGSSIGGHTYGDLLSEALTSTLSAADGGAGRRWNKRVDFSRHLREAMRSISSHWTEQFEHDPIKHSDATVRDDEGNETDLLELMPGKFVAADEALAAEEKLAKAFGLFKDDDEAILVLEGWRSGMNGPEIMQDLGLDEKAFNAAVRRIRYKISAEFGKH